MKKTLLKITIALFGGALIFTGCQKDETSPEDETPVTPGITASFAWTVNGSTNVTADSSFSYPSITTFYAFKNGLSNSIEVNLSSLNTGTYLISSSTGNSLTYISGTNTLTASGGTVNITPNSNNRLSGSLSATFPIGTVTSLSAQFSDLPKRN